MSVWIDNTYLPNIGVTVLAGGSEPALPSTRDRSIQIAGRHGAYDLGADLDVRQFEIPCAISGIRDHGLISAKAREVARLFVDNYGRPKTVKLRFETEPDRFYYARFSGNLPLEKVAYTAKFTLMLTAYDPLAKSTTEINDDIIMDSDVSVLADITLDASYSYTVTSAQTISIINDGALVVRPAITITGSATTLSLSVNGKSFTLRNFSSKTFEINGENYTVKSGGVNTLSEMIGDFLELMPGKNNIVVSGSSDMNVEISFRFYNQYI